MNWIAVHSFISVILIIAFAQVTAPSALAQMVVFEEYFTGSIKPEWAGDPDHFTTISHSSGPMLRLNGNTESGGISRLSIPSFVTYGSWEFHIMLDFATSNNNRSYVYLISDHENPEEGSGYAIRIGESGSAKYFRLVRIDEGQEADVITHGERLIEAGIGYNLKIERRENGIWQIHSSEGRNTPPQPDGLPGLDQTHQAAGWFILEAVYTATRADRFYWGDLRFTKNPPFVLHTGRTGPDRLRIHFSGPDLAGTDEPLSYRIETGTLEVPDTDMRARQLIPGSVHRLSSTTTELIFTEELSGGPARLRLTGIRDYYGQELAQTSLDLLLHDSPRKASVVITEYLYDDNEGLPQFVELYNPGPGWYDLKGWELRDRGTSTRIITENMLTLEPGGFLVVTPNAQALQNRFGSGPWLRMDRFPSLNRASSDQVRLIGPGGVHIDSLEYEPSVFNASGQSIERRSALVDSKYPENWAISEDTNGATPGLPNTVLPPDTPLRLPELRPLSASILSLQFSRPVDLHSIGSGQVSLIPFIPVNSVQKQSASEFLIHLGGTMVNATEYLINLESVTDIFGNAVNPSNHPFIYYHLEEAAYRDVVINEILYRPVEGMVPRFIELVNRSVKNVDLSGWTIGRSSSTATIPDAPDLILLPGEIAVFSAAGGPSDLPPQVMNVALDLPGYSRFGDSVFLRNRHGVLIDTLGYHPAWGGNSDGRSLERRDPDAASNDPANWRSHPNGHSAGLVNSQFKPDVYPPEVVKAAVLDPGSAELLFSEFLDTSYSPEIRVGGVIAQIMDFSTYLANRITIALPSGPPEKDTIIEIHQAVDVAGNSSGLLEVPLAHMPGGGDLVINEIMYQPLQNRYGSYPDQSQYVEFFNRSDKTVSLAGIFLHDEADKHGQVRSVDPEGHETAWIRPGAYGLIHADTAAYYEETSLSRFFRLDYEPAWLQARRSTLNLTSVGRAVYLSGQNGLVLDSVTYNPEWHNPNLHDKRGISLERIHPAGPSNDSRNWSSNVIPEGGTPGMPNSILQFPEPGESERSLSVTPNPFSPDGDGFDDHLFISYGLDSPDYLVSIHIFDRYGRPVRRLADRERAGFEGHFIWDGLNDSGIPGRIGIYVILFNAQDALSGKSLQIKQTAVLARPL